MSGSAYSYGAFRDERPRAFVEYGELRGGEPEHHVLIRSAPGPFDGPGPGEESYDAFLARRLAEFAEA